MGAYTELLSVGQTQAWKWANVNDDAFVALEPEQGLGGTKADVTMILTGTPDSVGVKLQGSHDNTNWVDIVDPVGVVILLTVAGTYAAARDAFPYMQPRGDGGGGGSQSVTVTVSITRAG